jgi:hypothetical protein
MTDDEPGFFMTAQEIYERITRGPGVRSVGFAQDATFDEWRSESDRAERIRGVANTIRSGWQGEASGAAYGAAMPLAESSLEGAAYLQNSHDLLTAQSESFHRVNGDVRPVPPKPPENSIDDKFPFDVDTDKEVTGYQSDVQHNFAVFGEYDNASQYNETNMPQEYHTTSRPGGDVSVQSPPDTIEVGEPEPGGPGDSGGPGEPGGASGDGSHPGGPAAGDVPRGPAGVPSGGSQTSPSDYRPPPPVSSLYSPVGQAPVSGGFVGGVPVGGYSGGGFGPRGGESSGGRPRGSAGGGGSPGGVRGGAGLGPGVGAGAGALAAEEAAARRAAQAAAAGAKPGAMGAPIGAGRNKDDEDAEHQRKILIEADAEDTFGSDVLTAPQVIGDDEYED